MEVMSDAAKKELHDLVDALPESEVVPARRYLEYLRDQSDPSAHLEEPDPFADMPDEERARLHAVIAQSREDAKAGKGIPAEEVLRELKSL